MQTALLEIAYKSLREYNFQYIAGVSFEEDTAIAWFNNQATHSAPLALYFVHDTFVKRILGKEYSIEVSNAPLKQQRYDGPTIDGNDSYVSKQKFSQFSIYVMISLVLVSTFYITFYIKVRYFMFHSFLKADFHSLFFSQYCVGKGEQRQISPVCQWHECTDFLGCVNSVGFTNKLHHHNHNCRHVCIESARSKCISDLVFDSVHV